MPVPSHIRRIVVIAVVGCATLAGWSSAAAARSIDDPTLHTTSAAASTAEPPTSGGRERGDSTLPGLRRPPPLHRGESVPER